MQHATTLWYADIGGFGVLKCVQWVCLKVQVAKLACDDVAYGDMCADLDESQSLLVLMTMVIASQVELWQGGLLTIVASGDKCKGDKQQ